MREASETDDRSRKKGKSSRPGTFHGGIVKTASKAKTVSEVEEVRKENEERSLLSFCLYQWNQMFCNLWNLLQ